ncbi:MAG: TIGR00296 family protein [Candidatus Micrarchaeota archaeon]
MGERLSLREGEILVRAARQAVISHFCGSSPKAPSDGIFGEARAIFVTISTYPKKELRGCIGFLEPSNLGEAACEAAVHAAFDDSRFLPLQEQELSKIVFEASILTPPTLLKCHADERVEHIKIPRDGLIIRYGASSGLLLPQVGADWNFTPQAFLEAVCKKAGLPNDMHKSPSAKIYTFEAQIFEEEAPEGKVVQKKLFM